MELEQRPRAGEWLDLAPFARLFCQFLHRYSAGAADCIGPGNNSQGHLCATSFNAGKRASAYFRRSTLGWPTAARRKYNLTANFSCLAILTDYPVASWCRPL